MKPVNDNCSCSFGSASGYWESLQQQLKVHMAKTRLREMHEQQLRRKLFKLKQEVRWVVYVVCHFTGALWAARADLLKEATER